MKILSFAVNNFRALSGGLENNRVDFKESNTIFLFGQNNVGKSTFLKAYEFFYKSDTAKEDDFFKKDINKKMEFELEVELDEFDFKKIAEVAPKKKDSLKVWLKNEKILKVKKVYLKKEVKNFTLKPSSLNWEQPEEDDWDETNYGSIGLDSIFQSCLPTPIFIKAMPSEKEIEEIINNILSEKAKRFLTSKEIAELEDAKGKIKELQNKMYNPSSISSYKKDVNEHFQKVFPNFKIELSEQDKVKWTEDKLGKKFNIHFEKIRDGGEIDENIPTGYEKIGHGAVRTAMFTLLLMQDVAEEFKREKNRKDYLVLFEEPELFLHPKLMRELRTLIYKVSEDDLPYQVLCASHSPQMIDISKPKSSLIRIIKNNDDSTQLFQVNEEYLKNAKGIVTKEELKQEMYEVLRFNPFICESFYADEVILIEGSTEEIILRGYLSEKNPSKDLFVVNCGTVNNIPFYQKMFSKFHIKYHVICDTDKSNQQSIDSNGNPIFITHIQKGIYEQLKNDYTISDYSTGLLRVHKTTFEPAHIDSSIPEKFHYKISEYLSSDGKPLNANKYWRDVLQPNLDDMDIQKVPIIKYITEIINH
jgi:predicted ATP-dependent endonuclease of OLD family